MGSTLLDLGFSFLCLAYGFLSYGLFRILMELISLGESTASTVHSVLGTTHGEDKVCPGEEGPGNKT